MGGASVMVEVGHLMGEAVALALAVAQVALASVCGLVSRRMERREEGRGD